MVEQIEQATLLGNQSQPIEFPAGLIGMEEWHQYVLVSHPAGGTLRILQSLDDQRISLLMMPAAEIVPDYRLLLSEADAQQLKYEPGAGSIAVTTPAVSIYCILSVQEEPFVVTGNLLGPLVINWESNVGMQVIVSNSNYSPRYPLINTEADHTDNSREA